MAASLSRKFDPVAFHARFRPQATACIDLATGETLTYRAFSDRATACAHILVKRIGAAAPGACVAILSRNSVFQTIISTACERAGAIFAPLNWRLTAPEIADLLRDCKPALVLAEPEFEATVAEAMRLGDCLAPLATPADVAGRDAPAPQQAPKLSPAPLSAPCILLYTSGTTGRAKGVIITRENAIYASLNFAAVASLDSRSVLLCDSPMFHTVGLCAITRTALFEGACVLLSDRFIPPTTLQRLSDPALGVTHYFVVPQMVEALMNEPSVAQADFSRMTALFSGGGPLSPALVKTCVDRGLLLVNGYGMSEIGSGIHMPLDADYMADNPEAVGFPAPWIEARITSDDGKQVADGDVGEIWLRGPSVSPGYWNQPEATAATRSQGWFRTGDLARQQNDGAFVIVDRLKDMYISGGENVYPAEVEAVLRGVEGVEDAAVVGAPDARWGEIGVAFIQLKTGGFPPAHVEAAIRRGCASRLARYKQPAHIRFVEAIPRTGSGKARKNLLRELFLKSAFSA
ncbi:MAG: AMP-binding protein [Alphaproteobacteria bacterium]